VIRHSNTDFQINPDPDLDVRWICPKMLWMHCLVGVTNFTKYVTNQPLIVRELLTNVQKSPIPQWWRKWKSDLQSTDLDHHQKLITSRGSPLAHPAKFGRPPFPHSSVILFTEWQDEWQNDHVTSALLVEVIISVNYEYITQ